MEHRIPHQMDTRVGQVSWVKCKYTRTYTLFLDFLCTWTYLVQMAKYTRVLDDLHLFLDTYTSHVREKNWLKPCIFRGIPHKESCTLGKFAEIMQILHKNDWEFLPYHTESFV